jgi:hypothetical protein
MKNPLKCLYSIALYPRSSRFEPRSVIECVSQPLHANSAVLPWGRPYNPCSFGIISGTLLLCGASLWMSRVKTDKLWFKWTKSFRLQQQTLVEKKHKGLWWQNPLDCLTKYRYNCTWLQKAAQFAVLARGRQSGNFWIHLPIVTDNISHNWNEARLLLQN